MTDYEAAKSRLERMANGEGLFAVYFDPYPDDALIPHTLATDLRALLAGPPEPSVEEVVWPTPMDVDRVIEDHWIMGEGPHPDVNEAIIKLFKDRLEALASRPDGWVGIESAPRDGRSVLVFCPRASDYGYERIRLTWRKDGKWQGANNTLWPPTHWTPLPPAPQPDE